jgi:putative DNA primase/helicase
MADQVEPIQAGYDWPDPKPLPAGLPAVDPFTYDLLPARLRPTVQDISERMQCPPEMVAVAMLASGGILLGRKIAIRPKRYDDWCEIPNLWALLVGPPSLLKSPAMRAALKTIYRLQADARREYAQAVKDYEAKVLMGNAQAKADKAELEKAVKAGDTTKAEELAAKMTADAGLNPPPEKVYITNDCTVEALGEVLNQNPDGVLLARDEISGWLRTMDREGHENDRGFYLEAWAGLDSYDYRLIKR